jgi:hypothetical protein
MRIQRQGFLRQRFGTSEVVGDKFVHPDPTASLSDNPSSA